MPKLQHPVDSISSKRGDYKDHGTSIRELVGQQGMRVIGRAFDLGIIKEDTREQTTVRDESNQGAG